MNDEVRLLAVHGFLHLLGYDHAKPAEEERMKELTNRVLALSR
jgi:probable rRNA maturation factor